MKIVAIIQARMGSQRLPGKVMMDLAGEPMLVRNVNRVRRAKTIQEIVIATTTQTSDDTIVDLCIKRGWVYFRGSEHDVLDRYYQASMVHSADAIVRITSDCPLIDAEIIDRVVTEFASRQPHIDYASNVIFHRTFPRGLDTEVMRFSALERAWYEASDPTHREHVTSYIYHNIDLFKIHEVLSRCDLSAMRWTVDTAEDLAFVRRIFNHFGHDQFSWGDVLAVLTQFPHWQEINSYIQQKVIA